MAFEKSVDKLWDRLNEDIANDRLNDYMILICVKIVVALFTQEMMQKIVLILYFVQCVVMQRESLGLMM